MKKMTRDQFKQTIKEQLEASGCKKISITLKFFGLKAVVRCKDKTGKKHTYEVTTITKRGKTICRYRDMSSLDWIDELEFYDAIFDDR